MNDPETPDGFTGSPIPAEGGPRGWTGQALRHARAGLGGMAALPAWPLLAGVALGFGLCCVACLLYTSRCV